jgi:hypothetical protein
MDVLALGGSKGGGSRTTSSVLLAAGARELGLHPLHFQVLPPGCAPSLDNARQVPFDTDLIPADDPELVAIQIRLLVQRGPECLPVIVSMLCKRIRTTMHMLPAPGHESCCQCGTEPASLQIALSRSDERTSHV